MRGKRLVRRALAWGASSVGCAAIVWSAAALAATGCTTKQAPPLDGAADGALDGGQALFDVNLPDTVVIVLEGGAEPGQPAPPARSKYVTLLSGLPTPCQDTTKRLGVVSFSQSGDDVIITSSKTKARARCTPQEPYTLLCDWVGVDGRPSVQQKPVTYGPGRPIGGLYDETHRFACKPQR